MTFLFKIIEARFASAHRNSDKIIMFHPEDLFLLPFFLAEYSVQKEKVSYVMDISRDSADVILQTNRILLFSRVFLGFHYKTLKWLNLIGLWQHVTMWYIHYVQQYNNMRMLLEFRYWIFFYAFRAIVVATQPPHYIIFDFSCSTTNILDELNN